VFVYLVSAWLISCSPPSTTAPTTAPAAGGPTIAPAATAPPSSTGAATSGGAGSSLGPIAKGPAALSGTVIIALNIEITGAGAQTGDLGKKATDIAVEKVNKSGGINGQPINLIVEDAQSSNQGALAALNKAGDDKAVLMIGPVKSTQILAISERIKELQMLSLIGGTNATLTRQGNTWLLRFRPDDSIAANAMVAFALGDLKASKIAILHDSDAFGTGGADIIEAALKAKNLSAASRQKYTTGTQDFTAQLLAIKSSGADTLCLYGTNVADDAVILRQAKEQGLKLNMIGSPSYGQTVVADLPADVTDGLYVVNDYFPGRTPEYAEYEKAWKDKYNSAPDTLSGWYWDAIHLAGQIIARVGADKNKVRDELLKTQGWKGAVGTFSFTANGDGRDSVDLMQYKNKNVQFVKTVKGS
jgi:branched-chain amino acid transport system substrate-binding protein